MAKKKAEEETQQAGTAEKITKSEAVRRAVAEGVDKPQEAVAFIKERYGVEITPQHFSSIKSQEAKKAGKPARRGRKPREAAVPASNGTPVATGGAVDLAKQLKSLVTRYGADEVSGMLAVLRD